MAWIESHQSLRRHPKLLRLASLLRAQRMALIGHLHCLWWWALDYAQDGDLSRYDDGTIAEAAEWTKKPASDFVAALTDAGWLDPNRSIHDWDNFAGRLLERRRSDAERKRAARTSIPAVSDVRRTSDGRRTDGVRTVPTNQPTVPTEPTEPNRSSPDSRAALDLQGGSGGEEPPFERSEDPVPVGELLGGGVNGQIDLGELEGVLANDQAHLMRKIVGIQSAFGRVSPNHIERIRSKHGDPVLTESLRVLCASPPAEVRAPARYLDSIVGRVAEDFAAWRRRTESKAQLGQEGGTDGT